MNLVLDIGNTRVKAALFEGKNLVEYFILEKNPLAQLKKIASDFPNIRFSIVSSVVSHSKEYINLLQHRTNCIELNYNTKLPITLNYATPETLGKDRIAAAVGAFSLFKNQNVLAIDAGTCVKFDFVSKDGVYEGGSISPGLEMRFKALSTFTNKLPLVSSVQETVSLIGKSTLESILSGVQNGIVNEILGMINEYKLLYPDLKTVLSGGDTGFFEVALKNSIFASPNLVLIGLNEILLENANKN